MHLRHYRTYSGRKRWLLSSSGAFPAVANSPSGVTTVQENGSARDADQIGTVGQCSGRVTYLGLQRFLSERRGLIVIETCPRIYRQPVVEAFEAVKFQMEQIPEEIWPFAEWLWNRHPHHVLEIGVRHGGTSALWHGLCTGKVIGIDWEGRDSLGSACSGLTKKRHQELIDTYPRFRSVLGDSRSQATLKRVDIGKTFDFIFIDGDHSYEGVRADFTNYRPLLSTGGCIAFHDIVDTPTTRGAGQGVFRFWSELKAQYPDSWREFCVNGEWGGIGVITF